MNYTRPTYHLEVQEGANFAVTFVKVDEHGIPEDLTGYTAKMEIKEGVDGVYSGYDIPYTNLVLTETPNINGSVVFLDGTSGKVKVKLAWEETWNLVWARGVYDIFLTSPDNEREFFMGGFFTILSSATKGK